MKYEIRRHSDGTINTAFDFHHQTCRTFWLICVKITSAVRCFQVFAFYIGINFYRPTVKVNDRSFQIIQPPLHTYTHAVEVDKDKPKTNLRRTINMKRKTRTSATRVLHNAISTKISISHKLLFKAVITLRFNNN